MEGPLETRIQLSRLTVAAWFLFDFPHLEFRKFSCFESHVALCLKVNPSSSLSVTNGLERLLGLPMARTLSSLLAQTCLQPDSGRSLLSSEMAQPVSVSGLGKVVDPAISPTARRLLYRSFSIKNSNIWRHQIPTAGDSPMPPAKLIPSSMIQRSANFSPDGKKVAFNSHASGTGEIWVCGADGSNLSQLTHLDGPRIFGFRWSPNGQDIIFSSASNGKHNLYLVKVDGGRIRRLTDTHFNEHSPSYSRDGRWVYFDSDRSGDSQVWKIPAGGGTAVRVTKRGGRNPLESVDGRTLYYI